MGKLSDDILKWTLDINGDPARKELTQVSNSTNKLERDNKALATEMAKLEAHGKKGSAEWKRYQAQIKANNETIRKNKERMAELRKEVGLNNLSAKELRKEMSSLKRQMDGLNPKSAEWKKLNTQFTEMRSRLTQINGSANKTNVIFGALQKLAPWVSFAAIGTALKGVVSKAIETRKEFSRYEAVLENTLGSQKEANTVFSELKQFASTTPFQLNELTGSYVKLVNQGFKPTMKQMSSLGDLAASQGKSFDQLTEAIIDAQVGENERLKEFGIRAQKNGDKIQYTFKGVTTEVDNNSESIRRYILSLGNIQGVAGGMAKISATIGGAISNAGDATDNLFNAIGKRLEPSLVRLMGSWTGLLNVAEKWVEIPTSEKLQDEQSEINILVGTITSLNEGNKDRVFYINELNDKYPDLLKGLDTEKVTNEQLLTILKDTNKEYEKKIKMAVLNEELTAIEEKNVANERERRRIVKQINNDYLQYVKDRKEGLTLEEKIAEIAKTSQDYSLGNGATGTRSNEGRAIEFKNMLNKLDAESNDLLKERNELLGEQATIDGGKESDPKVGTKKTVGNTVYEWDGKTWNIVKVLSDTSTTPRDTASMDEIQSIAAEINTLFASNTTTDQDWTDYMLKLTQQRMDARAAELDLEKEISAAREEMKDTQIQGIAQLAGALSGMFESGSALQVAMFAFEKAMAIATVWVNLAKEKSAIAVAAAEMATIPLVGPAMAAAYSATMTAKALANAKINTAIIAAQAVASFSKGKAEGGYTEPGGKYEPAGIVHKGEYVIPQEGVNNPNVRQIIDVMELARQNGSLARLDLRPVVASVASNQQGYAGGGSTSAASGSSATTIVQQSDPEMKELYSQLLYRLDNPVAPELPIAGRNGVVQRIKDYNNIKSKVSRKNS